MPSTLDDFLGSETFWKRVGDFAVASHDKFGRGAILLHEEISHQESANRAHIAVSFLPTSDASPMWTPETLSTANTYDTSTEFLVISIQTNGEALSMVMEKNTDRTKKSNH